ncbi:MAG: recombinase family protein [Anaerolineae bacterium]|nr:recombinase family protein [Anaerolineae bacterium]
MTSDDRYLHIMRQDCPLPPGTHVVIYCRDSGGQEQDRSVSQQIEAAREYCHHHNLVLDHTYVDEAKVSSNTDKRNQLQEMLADLRRNFKHINDRYKREKAVQENPFGVIFWKSNRLGRDSIEATNIKTDLRLRAITIIDLITSANTGNSAIDSLIEAFQQWQDEQALDEISENAKRGLAQIISTRDTDAEFRKYNPEWPMTGAYVGIMPGKIPRGFKGIPVQIGIYSRKRGRNTGEPRIVQHAVPDPDLWDRCYLAWEMRRSGATYGEVHKALKLFKNMNSYDTFFSNPIYIGNFDYGGKIYENFLPPMIPKEWFEAEQKLREERAKKLQGKKMNRSLEPRRVASEHLLSGLVVCGHIDGEEHPMNIEHIPGEKNKRGSYTFFMCTVMKNSRGVECQAKRMSMKSLDKTVIDNLLAYVLTMDNLRPLAANIAKSIEERSNDAGTRMMAVEDKLAEVQKSLDNIMDAIEKMGYATHLQQRYDNRKREEEELLSELQVLKALQANRKQISFISDEALEGWIEYMRTALESENKSVARRIIQQFVAKIVIKEGTGTLYYTFPFPDELYMPSYGNLDPRGLEPLTSTVRL